MANVFLKVVNMSISACWIILAILLLRLILKKAPKWINCVLWGMAGLRLVMPFSFESVFSLIPSAETITQAPDSPTPQIDSGVSVIDNQINGYIQGSYSESVTRPVENFFDINTVLAIVWLVGIAALLIYTLISFLRLKRKVRTAVLLHNNIYQSESVVSPFVLGIIKPRIYLPFHINGQDMEHVIAHEQAHIRRNDHLWKPLGFLILTLHWFNPMIWLGYILLCRDIELACDEKVVKLLNHEQRADYSQALLTYSVNRRIIAACPLAFGEVGVKDRVKSVLNYKKPAFWIIVVAIVASIVTAICFLTNPLEKGFSADPKPNVVVDDDKTTNGTSNSTNTNATTNTDTDTDTDTAQCDHMWGQWVEKSIATCQSSGIKERICHNCHAIERKETKATDHKQSDWIIGSVANVGKDGLKYIKCVYCNKRIEEKVIPAISENHQHAVAEWITAIAPTCTANGTQHAVCSCGRTIKTKAILAQGHAPVVDKSVAATCTSNGLTEGSHCSVCNAIIVEQKTVDSKGHTMTSKEVAATAGKEEHILHYCTACSYSYEEANAPSSPIKFTSNNNGTCSVTGLNDTTITDLVIPKKSPNGDTVVAVANRAFIKNTTLKSVTLPSTVKTLGEFAFYACTNLSSVNGTQYATFIDGSAFADCSALASLDLSAATTMDNYVCSGATGLSSVKLSNDLKKLPQGMFAGCTSLMDIRLPSSITVIGNAAFQSTNMESITLPDSVEEIEMYAFRYCSNLKSIKLSKNLKTIHPLVFERCSKLNNVVLPDGLKTLGRLAFSDCKSMTSINLPDTLTSIGDSCFSGCTALASATLPDTMTSIPMRLFSGCTALTNVTLPPNTRVINQEAFNGTAITSITIPDSCTSIGTSSFAGCKKLSSVSFGKNVNSIGTYAFSNCQLLTSISFPKTFESLGDWAFYNCSGLKSVYLGTSITDIGSGAFENCTGLTTVFLPKSLSVIKPESYDTNPFKGCSGTLDFYSDAPKSNDTWERYFGRVSYGVSYDEYLKLTQ